MTALIIEITLLLLGVLFVIVSEEEKEKFYPRSSKGYGSSGWGYEYKGSSYQIQNGKGVNEPLEADQSYPH